MSQNRKRSAEDQEEYDSSEGEESNSSLPDVPPPRKTSTSAARDTHSSIPDDNTGEGGGFADESLVVVDHGGEALELALAFSRRSSHQQDEGPSLLQALRLLQPTREHFRDLFVPTIMDALVDLNFQEAYSTYGTARGLGVEMPEYVRQAIKTATFAAIKNNRPENLWPYKLYVEMGFDPNFLDEFGMNLIGYAIMNDRLDIVSNLIEGAGVDPNVQDGHGKTPSQIAIEYDDLDAFVLLETLNADINAGYSEGMTPFLYAAKNGKHRILQYLLLRYNVNSVDNDNNTALHFVVDGKTANHDATWWIHRDKIVKLLIHNGANIDAVNSKGETPLWIAVESNIPAMIDVLLQYSPTLDIRVEADDGQMRTPQEQAEHLGYWMINSQLALARVKLLTDQ